MALAMVAIMITVSVSVPERRHIAVAVWIAFALVPTQVATIIVMARVNHMRTRSVCFPPSG